MGDLFHLLARMYHVLLHRLQHAISAVMQLVGLIYRDSVHRHRFLFGLCRCRLYHSVGKAGIAKEDLMDLRDWIAFFACLVICGTFYGSVGCVLVTLSGSKWERAIWITFMALSFYASWAIIDYILMLVK